MKKTTSIFRILALNTFWLGLSFKWNALHPIILPAVLLNYVPDSQKNTSLGLMTFVGLIVAMLVQPISGALSDGWVSRFGRRRPLMVLGTLFDYGFLAILGWAGGLTWLFIGYIGLQFSSNIAHGPAQGLLPDQVADEKLGQASAIKTVMDMLALIVASLVAGNLLDPSGRDPSLVILVTMGVMFVTTLVTIFFTPEEPTVRAGAVPGRAAVWRGLRDQFRVDFRANSSYWWLIVERLVFLLAIYGVQQFAQYYIQDVLQVENPVQATGNLMASLAVGLVLLSLAGGWLSDRFGAKRVLVAASLLAASGSLLLLLVDSAAALGVYGSILGAGAGLFLTANWALASRLAPGEEAGKYLGLTNIATAGSAALGRLWGPILDWLNDPAQGVWTGYYAMFIFGALCALASILLLTKVKGKHT
ncbi:MAG: MFS transporter [Anaerolineales bacterium]|nr:MFS transporter [Anaerolineales bacterium]